MIEFNLNLLYAIRYVVSLNKKKAGLNMLLTREIGLTCTCVKRKYVKCEKKTPFDFGSLEARFLFG